MRLGYPANGRLVNHLSPILECWRSPDFLDLANDVGTKSVPLFGPAASVVAAFNAEPSRRGLLSFLTGRARGLPENVINQLDPGAFGAKTGDSKYIRYAVARLRVASGKWSKEDVNGLVDDLQLKFDDLHLAEMPKSTDPASYLALLKALSSIVPKSRRLARRAPMTPLQRLARELGGQPSRLEDSLLCADLQLPTLPA